MPRRSRVLSHQPFTATRDFTRLRELCLVFLKLGVIGFGGPAAHMALMRQELVRRKSWLSDQEFVDLLGATSLIPGFNF